MATPKPPTFVAKTPPTFEEMKPEIDNHLRYLEVCAKQRLLSKEQPDSKQTEEVLEKISIFTGFKRPTGYGIPSFCADFFHSFGNYMVQEGICKTFLKLYKSLLKYVNRWKSQGYSNLCLLVNILWSLADKSREFGKELMANGCVPYLLEAIKGENSADQERHKFNVRILNTLRYIICRSPLHRDGYRNANAIPVLRRCMTSTHKLTQVMALVTISYVVNTEDERGLLVHDFGIPWVVRLLKEAVTDKDHYNPICMSAFDTLDAINHLIIADFNKAAMLRLGAIPLIIRMLEDDFSDEEHKAAVEALHSLSSKGGIRESNVMQGAAPSKYPKMISATGRNDRMTFFSPMVFRWRFYRK